MNQDFFVDLSSELEFSDLVSYISGLSLSPHLIFHCIELNWIPLFGRETDTYPDIMRAQTKDKT